MDWNACSCAGGRWRWQKSQNNRPKGTFWMTKSKRLKTCTYLKENKKRDENISSQYSIPPPPPPSLSFGIDLQCVQPFHVVRERARIDGSRIFDTLPKRKTQKSIDKFKRKHKKRRDSPSTFSDFVNSFIHVSRTQMPITHAGWHYIRETHVLIECAVWRSLNVCALGRPAS